MSKTLKYETITGHTIELDDPAPEVARFIGKVEALAAEKRTTEEQLIGLVYSDQNPILERSPVGGAPLVTKGVLGTAPYRILKDLLERKRIAEQKIDVEKLAAGYTLTTAEAAERLGVHESAIRQAAADGRLASWVKGGKHHFHPKWLDDFGAASEKRGRPGPAPAKRAGGRS
jgi:excisionase family DNA binding protein